MQKINVLLIGSGGRESALAYAIKKSVLCRNLYAIPGNPYIEDVIGGMCFDDISLENSAILAFCKIHEVGLVVVGPEQPLADGLADFLGENGVFVFGPSQRAAQIESSKNFMKDFCTKYSIPTAKYRNFTAESGRSELLEFAGECGYPIVLKTDGLAAGKGVVICQSKLEFERELEEYFAGKFGAASRKIVVEEFLDGREVSFFALSNGKTAIEFSNAGDYKRVFDGDNGPNTGGMGSYSPSPLMDEQKSLFVMEKIINPLVNGMIAEKSPYIGVIFAGLMLTKSGIKLIEFNARFGDPETQSMMMRFNGDIVRILLACARGDDLQTVASELKFLPQKAVNIVIAAGGYPMEYKKGDEITGLDGKNSGIFYAGVARKNGKIVTNGGRVLSVCAIGETYQDASENAYKTAQNIHFDGAFYRTDIAKNL